MDHPEEPRSPLHPVRFVIGEAMLLGGLRRRHDFASSEQGIARQWREFLPGDLPGRTGGELFGVICGGDATGIEYMCAVEVGSLAALPEVGRMRVPSQLYAVFAHAPGSSLRATWEGILAWLAGGDYQSAHRPDFERYPPGADPLISPGGIEVWVGVVPRV